MIIYRHKSNGKFVFKDKTDKVIKDKKILEYVDKLVIPPAYERVEIDYQGNKIPKMVYFGYDDKGRKQQIYSAHWRKKADKKKFEGLLEFGKALPKIYLDVAKHIQHPTMTKNKAISLIIKIISICYFRVGNLKYQKLYGSYGISNIKKHHITTKKDAKSGKNIMEIKFIGKKGVLNQCQITDYIIINELTKILSKKSTNDYIFTYLDKDPYTKKPVTLLIRAIDINNWLKDYDPNFTSKMFRTFDTNTLLLEFLHQASHISGHSPTQMTINQRKKIIVQSMKQISQCVNNTPAICKKSYANNDLIDMYIEQPQKYKKLFFNNNTSRVNFMNFLKLNV